MSTPELSISRADLPATVVSAVGAGDTKIDVRQHLEGDFPGGEVDLHYRFTLSGASIGGLVIEP